MTSWLDLDATDPFGLQTLPYGRLLDPDRPTPRVGVRIGGFVLDAAAAAEQAGMESGETWACSSLNRFLGRGPQAWAAAREWLTMVLSDDAYRDAVEPHLHPLDAVTMHLPFEVADYVDFYATEHHATNVGQIFRPDRPDLPAAWKHLPIGYHGRAGTVVASGTDVVRPSGQHRAPGVGAAVVRAERAPRHRGRGRVRRRRGDRPRYARCRSPRPETTSSGWSCSTTGAPATSRRGSTCRSARSSASRSRRASPRG